MIPTKETEPVDAETLVDAHLKPSHKETDENSGDTLERVIRSSLEIAADDIESAVLLIRTFLKKKPSDDANPRSHSHYFKSVRGLDEIDVYRVLELFHVSDPCIQHAVKKLLVLGGRGGGKSKERDVRETIDTLIRWLEIRSEDAARASVPC